MIAHGRVCAVRGADVDVRIPVLAVGARVRIVREGFMARGRVHTATENGVTLRLLDRGDGLRIGDIVEEDITRACALGMAALGRCLDPRASTSAPCGAIDVRERHAVTEPMWTGVRAIDALLTIGRGARIGVFGAPGAGKSTLLDCIVRGSDADCLVIGLVGERGREAERWIDASDSRTTIVCATSDCSPAERVAAAHLAFAQARALADRGLHVLLVLDSLARVAYALRELRSGDGEPVGRGGYPPSVFAELARLVEGAGNLSRGSITLMATVLNDGDDRDPVSEAARSLLDGHVQLSARLAHAGHFPAIDVLASTSRTMPDVVAPDHASDAAAVRRALALLEATADQRLLGVESGDAGTRAAVAAEGDLLELLRQGANPCSPAETLTALRQTADTLQRNYGYQL